MHAKFATTSSVKSFLAGVGLVEKRGASEASWLATIGEPGRGKTRTLQWWTTQHNGVYLRAKSNWSSRWLLTELAGELVGSNTGGTIAQLFGIVLRELVKQGRAIVIDEAWNMLHDAKLLETLRDLSDMTENLIVLGGEQRVTNRLSLRFPQIASRITEIVEFQGATLADVRICCDTLCEVPVADDLVAEIHRQSAGYLREIKNAIARVETHGKRGGGKIVGAKDMLGIELCRDRKAGLPAARR